MFRDKFVLALTAGFVAAVLAGYGWVLATGRTWSQTDFGLNPIEGSGLPPFLAGRIEDDSAVGAWAAGAPIARGRTFLRDEFIGFDHIMVGFSSAITSANRAFYATLLPQVPIVPAGIDTGGAYVLDRQDVLIRAFRGTPGVIREVPDYVAAAKRLARAHPDVAFVYYGVTPWGMTELAPEGYVEASTPAWPKFAEALGGEVGVGALEVTDWNDMFFATDHHWKPRGAYQGYRDVVSLIEQQDPALDIERLPFSERVFDTVVMRGATARRAALTTLSEPFRALTTPTPGVFAYLDGIRRGERGARDDYIKSPPSGVFGNHYGRFYGRDYPIIEYRSDTGDQGRLLVFSDSFSNSMENLLAAPFERTWVVDLRYYEGEVGEPFDIDEFIERNAITHVVFLSRQNTTMEMPLALEEGRAL